MLSLINVIGIMNKSVEQKLSEGRVYICFLPHLSCLFIGLYQMYSTHCCEPKYTALPGIQQWYHLSRIRLRIQGCLSKCVQMKRRVAYTCVLQKLIHVTVLEGRTDYLFVLGGG